MTEPQVHVRCTTYDVSLWPDGMECMDASSWTLTVEYRGYGLWAVTHGSRECLGSDGEWDWEPIPSERDDAWRATHRFPLEEALLLARSHAAAYMVNGKTAAEVYASHLARHGETGCA